MRVMVVVMVPIRHETITVPERIPTVKPEIAMSDISFPDELPVAVGSSTRQLLTEC
jgi:hypothetical protein